MALVIVACFGACAKAARGDPVKPPLLAGSPSPEAWGRFKEASMFALIGGATALGGGIALTVQGNGDEGWAAFMVIAAASQLFYANNRSPYLYRDPHRYMWDMVYFGLIIAAVIVSLVAWAIGGRWKVMVWNIVHLLFSVLGMLTEMWRRKEVVEGMRRVESGEEMFLPSDYNLDDGDDVPEKKKVKDAAFAKQLEAKVYMSTFQTEPVRGRKYLTLANWVLRLAHLAVMWLLAAEGIKVAANR